MWKDKLGASRVSKADNVAATLRERPIGSGRQQGPPLFGRAVVHRLLAALLIAVSTSLIAFAGLATNTLGGLQVQAEDVLQPGATDFGAVVVVGIDREALDSAGEPWPWSRQRHAELLNAIGAGQPALVLYDVLLADERAGDEDMVDALRRTPTILGTALELRARPVGPPEIVERTRPTEDLARAAVGIGHTNISVSPSEGVVRSLPLVALDHRGVVEPSVVLAALARLDGVPQTFVQRPEGVQIGSRFVPLDDGELRINWAAGLGPRDIVSAVDVLEGSAPPSRFEGRIVIVGVSEPTLGDLHLTPGDRSGSTPGAIVLANALNTVLSRSYLRAPPRAWEYALTLLVVMVVAAIFAFRSVRWGLAAMLLTVAGVVIFTTWRFHQAGVIWNLVWPALAAVTTAIVATGWRYVDERRSRLRALELVEQFVPTPVARRLLDRHAGSLPEGELTFLMTDIVGSTASWEADPELMRAAIARHDQLVEEAVEAYNGALVRPRGEGDSRFAVFLSGQQAAEAALAFRDSLEAEDWHTMQPLRVRIGLNVGEAELRQHDYYGTAVNRCARIRSLAQPGQVLAAEALVGRLTESVACRDLDLHQLKDIPTPARIFEIRWAGAKSTSGGSK